MAMHTYIGARYVPRFMGTYDPTQIYDALDVVDNGSGTSYIARKTVPAGTPLTDTDHWFVYGASSGAIIQLQNDMIQAQNDISNIDNVKIPALQSKMERNIIILGNSYVNQGLCNALETSFDNHYHFTRSGCGFMPNSGHAYDFGDVLDDAIADTSYTKSSITDILIVSAVGDSRSISESGESAYRSYVETLLATMETKIATNYPNATRVGVVLGESRGGLGYNTLQNFNSIFLIHKIFKNILEKYNFEYIGWAGFNIMFEAGMMDNDDVHLSTLGYKTAGTWLHRAYFGNADYRPYKAIGTTPSCKVKYTATSAANAVAFVTPDNVNIFFSSMQVTAGDAVTITNNSLWFTAMDLDKPLPCPNSDEVVFADYINPFDGVRIEACRLQLTTDLNGLLKIMYFGTPAHANVPSGVGSMATPSLYNLTYFV